MRLKLVWGSDVGTGWWNTPGRHKYMRVLIISILLLATPMRGGGEVLPRDLDPDWDSALQPTVDVAHDEIERDFCTLSTVYCGQTVEELIREIAPKYGVSTETALRIAWCESRYDAQARNKNSTAKGVYQFLDGTWNAYGQGNVLDPIDNITAFMRLYPSHPSWWECK